jgi:hypothetical protein
MASPGQTALSFAKCSISPGYRGSIVLSVVSSSLNRAEVINYFSFKVKKVLTSVLQRITLLLLTGQTTCEGGTESHGS